jgi:hypothetical protein
VLVAMVLVLMVAFVWAFMTVFMGWQKDAPMSTGLGNASSDQTSSMACCSRLRVHSRTAYCHDECVSHCRAALVTRKAPIRTPWRRCLVESQDSSP